MVAENLLSNSMVPLRTDDKGKEALAIMNLFSVRHLPVVENGKLVGVISEDEILAHEVEAPIQSYGLQFGQASVFTYDHVYEIMRQMAEKQLTAIPVINEQNDYIGLISQDELLKYFANTSAFVEHGSIVVLEIGKRDYSLAEISRLVESENATILSSFITSRPDSQKLDVTLKLNTQTVQGVLNTLERFGYTVKASFSESDYLDTLKERYDSLMSFLNV
ncbi:MAG: CBS domain-containing protein [Saprospiraceae bacterium]